MSFEFSTNKYKSFFIPRYPSEIFSKIYIVLHVKDLLLLPYLMKLYFSLWFFEEKRKSKFHGNTFVGSQIVAKVRRTERETM